MFKIKELFLLTISNEYNKLELDKLVIDSYYFTDDVNFTIETINILQYLLRLCSVSKIHNQWVVDYLKNNSELKQIKICILWLNKQKLNKHAYKNHDVRSHITMWGNEYITKESMNASVRIYNTLNKYSIVGKNGYFNIRFKYTWPGNNYRTITTDNLCSYKTKGTHFEGIKGY